MWSFFIIKYYWFCASKERDCWVLGKMCPATKTGTKWETGESEKVCDLLVVVRLAGSWDVGLMSWLRTSEGEAWSKLKVSKKFFENCLLQS